MARKEKENDQRKPKKVVEIISSDEEKPNLSARKSATRSSRKEVKTLTSILTARSKVI